MWKYVVKICLVYLLVTSCNEKYYYIESTIDPYKVYDSVKETVQTVSPHNYIIIKAKDDDDAKIKAASLFQNRVNTTTIKDFKSRIINGYSLRKEDYFGVIVSNETIVPGVNHADEKKDKAFDIINFGDNPAKVKERFQTSTVLGQETFTCVFIGGKPYVQKGSFGGISPNYALDNKTITTRISIKDHIYTASFFFGKINCIT